MARLAFYKVTSLPNVLEANAFYFVKRGSLAEGYLTDTNGVAAPLVNRSLVEEIIAEHFGGATTVEEQAIYYAQPFPSSVWTITHGRAGKPFVTVTDGAGSEVIADVRHPSHGVVTIRFGVPVAGIARLV